VFAHLHFREPPALQSVTRAGTGQTATVCERLVQFAVNARGMMVAVYNSRSQSCAIKIKSVATRVTDDWHFQLRSEVPLFMLVLCYTTIVTVPLGSTRHETCHSIDQSINQSINE